MFQKSIPFAVLAMIAIFAFAPVLTSSVQAVDLGDEALYAAEEVTKAEAVEASSQGLLESLMSFVVNTFKSSAPLGNAEGERPLDGGYGVDPHGGSEQQ